MKSTLALAVLFSGLLIGCQSHPQSAAPRTAAPPAPMADYPAGSLGLLQHIDGAPTTPFQTADAASA